MDLQRNSGAPRPVSLGQQPQLLSQEQNLPEQQSRRGGSADGNLWSNEWSAEEQRILSEELVRVPATLPPTERYVLIACKLPNKTARQVAQRAVWLARKEAGKRRKNGNEDSMSKRTCREPSSRSASTGTRIGGLIRAATANPTPQTGLQLKSSGSLPSVGPISDANKGLGEAISQLLEANYVVLHKIKKNMACRRVHENNDLLSQFRDNLHAIMNHMEGMRGVMGKMPQLAVHINNELAGSVLSKTAPDGGLSTFPTLGPVGLPMGPSSGSPIHFSGVFPGFMPCMMPGAVPVNIPGVSLAPPPSHPRHVNMPPRTETNVEGLMAGSPFVPLGMLPRNPHVGELMVRPVDHSFHQGLPISMHQQDMPLTRLASAPGSLCTVPCVDDVAVTEQFLSGGWSIDDQWRNKGALKRESLMSVASGAALPGMLNGMAAGVAANNAAGPHMLQDLQAGDAVKGAYQEWGLPG